MRKLSLDAVGREQLERAQDAPSGRSSSTVVGGHEQVLRQTVIALREGSSLTEHNSPGKAGIELDHRVDGSTLNRKPPDQRRGG